MIHPMRVVRGLLVLALAVPVLPVEVSAREECACRGPEQPELPSRRADAREMAQAAREVEQYVAQMRSYRACLARCLAEADGVLSGTVEEWNRAVEGYNMRAGAAPKEHTP